jgi:hypothetical protein
MAERNTQFDLVAEDIAPASAHRVTPLDALPERVNAERFVLVPDQHHRLEIGALERIIKSRLGRLC